MRLIFKILFLVLMLGSQLRAQFFSLDTIDQYEFVRYDLNRISVKDSSTLLLFLKRSGLLNPKIPEKQG